jgi:geranylgeranyl pyrophosphate synthase
MIEASLVMGGLIGKTSEENVAILRRAGRHLGLAFQIIDDILDATADTKTLGKTAGKDAKADKATFVKLHGLDASRRFAAEQSASAHAALKQTSGNQEFLAALIDSMATRVR